MFSSSNISFSELVKTNLSLAWHSGYIEGRSDGYADNLKKVDKYNL